MGKLKNIKATLKDEITGGCVIWPLIVVLCLKTGDSTRVKERAVNG